MDLHFRNCHSPAGQMKSLPLSTARLPFILLPPGTWDIRQVVEHYRKVSHILPAGVSRRQIDWSRLAEIESLKPVKCYIGKDSWLGYVVFEFTCSDSVLLECPIQGNATYILSGDWKAMVRFTKAEIRQEFADFCTKIVHKGDWLYRIREALDESRLKR